MSKDARLRQARAKQSRPGLRPLDCFLAKVLASLRRAPRHNPGASLSQPHPLTVRSAARRVSNHGQAHESACGRRREVKFPRLTSYCDDGNRLKLVFQAFPATSGTTSPADFHGFRRTRIRDPKRPVAKLARLVKARPRAAVRWKRAIARHASLVVAGRHLWNVECLTWRARRWQRPGALAARGAPSRATARPHSPRIPGRAQLCPRRQGSISRIVLSD